MPVVIWRDLFPLRCPECICPGEHGRTADMERRAGPACPTAGVHRKTLDRLLRSTRQGVPHCPVHIRPGAWANGTGYCKEGRRPPPADGVGTAALGLTPRGLRHLRMALWDDWGFRPLRRAGVRAVRGATRDSASGLRDFLKKSSKTFYSVVASWASQQDVSRFQNSV